MADEKMRLIRARNGKRATFKRQCLHQKKKLDDVWRRPPRGLQSKQRMQKRAKGRLPRPGFGGPAAVRGFHPPSGYEEVLVFAPAELEGSTLRPMQSGFPVLSVTRSVKRFRRRHLSLGLRYSI